MSDYLELGPVPCDETCNPSGMPESDATIQLAECRRYRQLLMAMFPDYDRHGCRFLVKTFGLSGDHPSREVVIEYDRSQEASIEYAFHVERNLPFSWEGNATLAAFVQSGNWDHLKSFKYPVNNPNFF